MNILRISTSIKGNYSQSAQLGQAILQKILTSNPEAEVLERNLSEEDVPHLTPTFFQALYTSPQNLTSAQQLALQFSDRSIEELQDADILLLEVPMYNFTIPSSLKAWIDHILRAGKTFRYTENGAEGLVKNKKVLLAISTGGIYSEGPQQSFDFTESYLRATLGMMGITDIEAIRIEGTGIPEFKDVALDKALLQLEEKCAAHAQSLDVALNP
jgi:FMN-dependent NADH-azoreductase